jgi:hypothetical protein
MSRVARAKRTNHGIKKTLGTGTVFMSSVRFKIKRIFG